MYTTKQNSKRQKIKKLKEAHGEYLEKVVDIAEWQLQNNSEFIVESPLHPQLRAWGKLKQLEENKSVHIGITKIGTQLRSNISHVPILWYSSSVEIIKELCNETVNVENILKGFVKTLKIKDSTRVLKLKEALVHHIRGSQLRTRGEMQSLYTIYLKMVKD